VVPDKGIDQQPIDLSGGNVEKIETIELEDGLPVRLISCFYGGAMPLRHREGPRLAVELYRIRRPFVATLKKDEKPSEMGGTP